MSTVALKPLDLPPTPDGYHYFDMFSFGPGSPPDRPTPGPNPPDGIWGPNDPRPTNPIAGPGRPPWWGMAQDPGYGIDIGSPVPPIPGLPEDAKVAVVAWAPSGTPTPPPPGPDAKPMLIVFAKGSPPVTVMVPPYVDPRK